MDASITSPRLFVPASLAAGAAIAVTPAQAHHLGTVLRRAVGDPVRLFNGSDGEWAGRIAMVRRDRCEVVLETQLRPQAPEPDLWLAFAPLKRDAIDLVAEKATELGAAALLPVLTERTVASRVNTERLAAIATEAAAQCERLSVPRIEAPVRLPALLASWPGTRALVVAVERSTAPRIHGCPGPAALLVGPEGGFTGAELDLLARHAFVQPVSLGPRILRAETAAIVGLALLQAPAGG
ncbi:Ribosomal RNA small subunit methyltransferase E [Rhodovastum atsumiense]|uniref:Ribosomal RNA small subunit methyltransferase E n=2 Tax=Rhodovastum atsumiense TaxID=504468 RepID=A0A5M6IS16_9PROT|nr:16S rRNA (uracil(1498)-N(3))-methyltransferase [Rhodovastum atsumiense]CAH2600241.1 Ribosomal RNA small subunit methyltransferase E [Rhodovastum atsumiense]